MQLTIIFIPIIAIIQFMIKRDARGVIIQLIQNQFQTHYQIVVFDPNIIGYQFQFSDFAIDGISQWLIWLINMLMPILILNQSRLNIPKNDQSILLILIIGLLSILVFLVIDILYFYIAFEGILIPMYIYISLYGSKNRKIYASYSFILYTLTGSLFQLIGIQYLYLTYGTTNQIPMIEGVPQNANLLNNFIWLCFFIAFVIKQPLIPFHSWLIITHTESPTIGSVILAAILQKMGSYGLIRFNIPLFPNSTEYFKPQINVLCTLSIIYTAISAFTQIDQKQIIAYSSIGHQATATLGLFSNDYLGIQGSIFFMISHGQISSAQFLLVGFIYSRYHTRTIIYYRGLVQIYPIYVLILWFFTMANSAVPGTSGFTGEFLSLFGIFTQNPWIAFWSSLSIILVPTFMLRLLHSLSYGQFTPYFLWITNDLTRKEFNQLIPQILFTLIFGLFPNLILDHILISCLNILHP